MKKIILFIIMCFILFLNGCILKTNKDSDIDDIYDKYTYDECIYLSLLSSSLLNHETEKNCGKIEYDIFNSNFNIHSNTNSYEYDNVEYIKRDVDYNLNQVYTINSKELLKLFHSRYDIYRNGEMIGYSIFIGEDVCIAKINNLGIDTKYTIWEIIKVKK